MKIRHRQRAAEEYKKFPVIVRVAGWCPSIDAGRLKPPFTNLDGQQSRALREVLVDVRTEHIRCRGVRRARNRVRFFAAQVGGKHSGIDPLRVSGILVSIRQLLDHPNIVAQQVVQRRSFQLGVIRSCASDPCAGVAQS
jgi:hypothetical protein